MDSVKSVIDLCVSILNINIHLFEFTINLMNVLIFGGCIYLVVWFIYRLFR